MFIKRFLQRSLMCALALASLAVPSFASPLMAGTGKVNIDPAPALLPIDNGTGDAPLTAIHDSLFARALILSKDNTKIIFVVSDLIILPDDAYERLVSRISDAYGVSREHIMLSATHVHTVPWSLGKGYEKTVSDGIMAAIAQAGQNPEAVTVGAGSGRAFINMNRDEQTPQGFILGQNPAGASDKTVRVVGFYRADGRPLAILANYAVHAVTLHSSVTGDGRSAMISADIPGATDRFVDAHYPGAMTFWTSGAAGDQNPVMMSIYAEPGADGKPVFNDLKAAGFLLTERWGQNLALEIIRITDVIKPQAVTLPLRAAQTVVTCPAKTGENKPIRLSYLGIGTTDMLAVSGEVGTLIDHGLRRKTDRDPLMLTLTNGYSGYIPDDASYILGQTFEVQHSFLKGGCAEQAIIDGSLKLLETK